MMKTKANAVTPPLTRSDSENDNDRSELVATDSSSWAAVKFSLIACCLFFTSAKCVFGLLQTTSFQHTDRRQLPEQRNYEVILPLFIVPVVILNYVHYATLLHHRRNIS